MPKKNIIHIFNSKSILDGNITDNLPIGLFGDFYNHELTFFLIEENNFKNIKQVFNKIGLEIDTVYKEYNSDVPYGNVTWQYPKGGDLLSKGMGMHLTISLGVPPNFYQVPNVFGLSKKKAINQFEKSGFKLGKLYYKQNEDLIPYTVLDQSIKPGTILEKPSVIDLTISVLDMQDIFNNIIE